MTYRKTQISRIKYFNASNSFQTLNLTKNMSINMLATLYNKFSLNKKYIDEFVGNNKNLGVILNLAKRDINYSNDWKRFIELVIPKKKNMSNSDNSITSSDCSKLLLITNKKNIVEDLKNLNNLIFKINKIIKECNNKNFNVILH